jgi:hypothetical protein
MSPDHQLTGLSSLLLYEDGERKKGCNPDFPMLAIGKNKIQSGNREGPIHDKRIVFLSDLSEMGFGSGENEQ